MRLSSARRGEDERRLRRRHVCPTIGPGLRDALVHAKVR